jgi:hypothetical protein
MSDEKKFTVSELDTDDLEDVAGGQTEPQQDVDVGCSNTYCEGANCVAGCGGTTPST